MVAFSHCGEELSRNMPIKGETLPLCVEIRSQSGLILDYPLPRIPDREYIKPHAYNE